MRYQDTLWCDGCGAEIRWRPRPDAEQHYCCTACFAGQSCDCGTHLELEDDRRARAPAQAAAAYVNG